MKISTDVVHSQETSKKDKNNKKRKRDNTSAFIFKWAKNEDD